jgi:superfamily II DNA/RNA helicase
VLVFGRTKHGVERLSKQLEHMGIKSESIHGNKTQNKRQRALDLFKRDHVQVLCATDVAARGLDIAGVSHVINYDLPTNRENYIHRIGRSGRFGRKGVSINFITQVGAPPFHSLYTHEHAFHSRFSNRGASRATCATCATSRPSTTRRLRRCLPTLPTSSNQGTGCR